MRIKPLSMDELTPELRETLSFAQEVMGFSANDVLTMAKWPALLSAMQQLVATIYAKGELDDLLKRMIGMIVSAAAGCRYCQAHTAHGAAKILPNISPNDAEKLQSVWEYSTSHLFNNAERAALDLALAAGQSPNAASDNHFINLRKYFSEQQIMEIMGVIGLFGFLNRWNDSIATTLEQAPLDYATSHIDAAHWTVGKHEG
ncbi:carboxymuconolactone decarboxylase [Sphingorhabdus lutea]|uniref:Carboxymuconolactone decarboxylase n=1 Tax=Sphingorhabdus lutea TaxID=1913578 RepID=A0A1L3J930_9SPHN|nr:carboxymuconolactone decarboxylase family protein [Sphingorhabdus lutea]APG61646.1 carboxymuconolactone decarboxylase [Sphingorhabdus lutea]